MKHACLLIPHYDHFEQFRLLLPRLVETELPLLIVDDASPAGVVEDLEALLHEKAPGSHLIRHDQNKGKGGAVMTGLRAALELGYSHAVQVDADGQHDLGNLPELVRTSNHHPEALVCGAPCFDDSISGMRKHARKITHHLCRIEAMSSGIVDALCGFRCYPLESIVAVINRASLAERMGFDPEILVRASWAGIEIRYVPVNVTYPEDGVSHFHYFADNLEITWTHIRLLFGGLMRSPMLIWRNIRP